MQKYSCEISTFSDKQDFNAAAFRWRNWDHVVTSVNFRDVRRSNEPVDRQEEPSLVPSGSVLVSASSESCLGSAQTVSSKLRCLQLSTGLESGTTSLPRPRQHRELSTAGECLDTEWAMSGSRGSKHRLLLHIWQQSTSFQNKSVFSLPCRQYMWLLAFAADRHAVVHTMSAVSTTGFLLQLL